MGADVHVRPKKSRTVTRTRGRSAKTLVALLACASLTSCAADSDTALVGKLLLQQISGAAPQKISREQAAAIPYASMGLQLGSGPEALLVLGAATPEQRDWYAGDQIVVITRLGRVIQTVGLPYDLGGAHPLPANSPAGNAGAATAGSSVLVADFPDLGIFGARINCEEKTMGMEAVEILGADISVRHDVEHCIADTMDWQFDNDFWRDPQTGYVWRSLQHIHPKSPPVILEVFRPEQNGPG